SDLTARVIQHENDHLDGKMIVDYATLPKKLRIKKKLKDLENGIIPPPSKEEDSDDSNPER
ncbi:MAG: peptide deformylase, partial [Candidatus Omnitrophica bacterium]|nr:peptide deformylase [Candidatus Omnitrophota bacterium]